MKSRYLLGLGICSVAVLAACSDNSPTYSTVLPGNSAVVAVEQTNAAIIGELLVLNRNEISAAQIAREKATNPQVKKYADFLYRQHNDNLNKTMRISRAINAPPVMNSTALNLQNQGMQTGAQLRAANQNQFDSLYINDMVIGHRNAIRMLDGDIKKSTNPQLTSHLKNTRHHVMQHLIKAETIQKEMNRG